MTNKLLTVLLAIGLTAQLSGCSSGGSKEDGQAQQANDSQFSQEGEGDFAQAPKDGADGGNPQDQVAADGQQGGGGDKAASQAAPQDMGQDLALDGQQQKPAGDAAAGGQAKGGKDELSLDDAAPLPDDVASNTQDPKPADGAAPAAPPADDASKQAAAAPPTDEPLFKNDGGAAPKPEEAAPATDVAAAAPAAPAAPEAPKSFAPLQKIKDAAFDKNGTNLNRVYLARAGDNIKSVSQKLYGKNRAKDLKAWNPILNRGVKTGDKIYYQSATNPDDKKMMVYYEEMGIQPSIYTSKDGDNIRKVSKQLLGSGESWKEVWATNPNVESKGDIPPGLEIRYWPDSPALNQAAGGPPGETAAPKEVAANTAPPPTEAPAPPPPEPPPMPGAPPPQAGNVPPAPPAPPMTPPQPASTPENPGQPGAQAGIAPPPEQAPPPPPPPPPPPEPKPIAKKAPPKEDASAGDPDTMMAMGVGGILLMAAAVLYVVLKRNRAKRVDLGQTQV